MLNTYIKNRGITQTLINNNNHQQLNQIDWDADYDGENANISLTSNTDGNKNHFDIKLDNEDLANMLNVPSVNMPIHKRLQRDFNTPSFTPQPILIRLEIPHVKKHHRKPSEKELLQSIKPDRYLSSPLPNEELIVPISIDGKTIDKYTLTTQKRHRRPKTHKTYKVYKKPKSYSNRKIYKSTRKNTPKRSKSYSIF